MEPTGPQLTEWLSRMFTARMRDPVGMVLSYALATNDGRSHTFAMGLGEFCDRPVQARPGRDYGTIYLGEQWFDLENARVVLLALLTGSDPTLDGKTVAQQFKDASYDLERKVLPRQTISKWSEWAAAFRIGSSFLVPGYHDPLVRTGLPPHNRAIDAAADWVWSRTKDPFGASAHEGELTVVIPDTRARVTEATWQRTSLQVTVELGVPAADVEVQCRLETVSGPQVLEGMRPDNGLVEWNIPPTTTRADVFIVHHVAGLLAAANFTNTGGRTTTSPENLSAEEQVSLDILAGETEVIEFKPFFREPQKRQEIAEVIIAFANSRGGRLYIGLDDRGKPFGDDELAVAVGGKKHMHEFSLQERQDRLKEELSKLVREIVKPVPAIATTWLTVGGQSVLLATVAPGTDRPYSTHDNLIYVRKGATCRPPEPKTELPGLFPDRRQRTFPSETTVFPYDTTAEDE
jgi:Putative DNA-binding domain